jgi:hypothetical protein
MDGLRRLIIKKKEKGGILVQVQGQTAQHWPSPAGWMGMIIK